MRKLLSRLFGYGTPAFGEARPTDAAAIAAIHAASFQRGWGEDEIQQLLADRAVVADRAMSGRRLIGFIVSRRAANEAEILSIAIAAPWRGRALARPLLHRHLRRLAGLGTQSVFLEVDEHNTAACRLYRRAGFYEVGRRARYYQGGGTALVLRRDL